MGECYRFVMGAGQRPHQGLARRDMTCEYRVAVVAHVPRHQMASGPGRGHHLAGGDDVPDRTCSIEGCNSPHLARGWCSRHYQRWQQHADPCPPANPRRCCSVEGCERPHKGHGWCNKHYQHWKQNGEPERPTAEQRFWAKVNKHGPIPEHRPDLGPCWIWNGALNSHGYGNFGVIHLRVVGAHCFAYETTVGPVPDGLELDHLCRVRSCVKPVADEHGPAHLEPVTSGENKLRSPLRSRKRVPA